MKTHRAEEFHSGPDSGLDSERDQITRRQTGARTN